MKSFPTAALKSTYSNTGKITLFKKLLGLACLILALCGLVLVFLRLEIAAYGERDDVRNLNVFVLKAHRHERDFLVNRSMIEIQRFNEAVMACDSVLQPYQQDNNGRALQSYINEYRQHVKTIVATMQERGLNENSGAEGAFRKSVHSIENIVERAGQHEMMNALLQARRNEKDFILRRQDKYVTAVQHTIEDLRAASARAPLPQATKEEITVLSENYLKNFAILVGLFKNIDALDTQSHKDFEQINLVIGTMVQQKESTATTYRSISLMVLLIAPILALWIAVRTARNISNPVVALAHGADRVSQGDFSAVIDVHTRDEISHLALSFNLMVESIRVITEELHIEKQGVEQKVHDAVQTMLRDKLYLSKSVETMLSSIERFANGDLTTRLQTQHHDEQGDILRLYHGFNRAIDDIEQVMSSVATAVSQTAAAGMTITNDTNELNAGAKEQTQQTSNTARLVEEMAAMTSQAMDSVNVVSIYATQARENAKKGVATVEHTTHGIQSIVEATRQMERQIASLTNRIEKIDEVVSTIREIADQTNMLALNASIEAARAGEHGRGFAVVADEVKKLADRTAEATKEITVTIRNVQQEAHKADESMTLARQTVQNGIELTQGITYTFEEILNDALQVSSAISQIQASSKEQKLMSEKVSANVQTIATVVMQSEDNIKRLAGIAGELQRSMEEVQRNLEHFTLSKNTDAADDYSAERRAYFGLPQHKPHNSHTNALSVANAFPKALPNGRVSAWN